MKQQGELVILYRGERELRRFRVSKAPEYIRIRYDKPYKECDQMAESVVETFTSAHWFPCPNCGAHYYASRDHMSLPDWVIEAESVARPDVIDAPGVIL